VKQTSLIIAFSIYKNTFIDLDDRKARVILSLPGVPYLPGVQPQTGQTGGAKNGAALTEGNLLLHSPTMR
jgi:hypothetical protein